ncbi:ornithine cyclodeaminase [Paenibacillus uliginis N3/975]|uniref:Ornithine cyclodeaminase n=1 Tax=Paenibacillus uliginis N3/975 TaxID=1313296 RepID=A0A1X7GYZ5_9BACL|nr:2,3-diaminopropionate biosynthesis protein SbnB [Paenibacillus uliginis]SMF76933.1 ornithine cyclodeaminase [Paenibacillus uliginis N3/975]
MLYLNEHDLQKVGIKWEETIEVIRNTIQLLDTDNIVQPIKPYLRFKDQKNRIIAMPAYVGEGYDVAGIKWIASFPDNINKGISRANSVVILNNADTGQVKAIVNGSLLSVIRTVSVSGLFVKLYLEAKSLKRFSLGILGWGPIGQHHYQMCRHLFEDQIESIYLYDINNTKFPEDVMNDSKVRVCGNWRDVYSQADVFITCTVSSERYIDSEPKQGSLLLNVSLRDYKSGVYEYVKNGIVVDSWKEVCRENTDVELFHLQNGLMESDVLTFKDIVSDSMLEKINNDQSIMINPMGMSAFDMSIGEYYFRLASKENIGLLLE